MKRAAFVLVVASSACLQTGSPTYGEIDTTPPTLLSSDPDVFHLAPDAGTTNVHVSPAQTLVLTFSDIMDTTTLRPGIVIRTAMQELPLTIQADALPVSDQDLSGMSEYPVDVSAGQGTFADGTHSITLRTLLLDQHGNPLAMEMTSFFDTP